MKWAFSEEEPAGRFFAFKTAEDSRQVEKMNNVEAKHEGLSFVILGAFNPKIFHPAWFAAQKLIRIGEAEAADVDSVNQVYAGFRTEWFQCEVDANRFVIKSNSRGSFAAVRDLVVGTFQILSHVHVTALGMNTEFHFPMKSQEEWHKVGDTLAPKEIWKTLFKKPGLQTITIQGNRDDERPGQVHVAVSPSTLVRPGVYVNVNDHYPISDSDPSVAMKTVLEILMDSWEESARRSEHIAVTLLESI